MRGEEYMPTDKQYNGQLIEEYQRLERVLESAKKENASETIALIKNDKLKKKLERDLKRVRESLQD